MPALSVIIPVYNAEKTLSRAIESILGQRISDYEIILVDDGSEDRSEIIASEYIKEYNFIKYYKKENGGVCTARNMGIENACGDYITFMDNDDELEQGYYNAMLKEALSGQFDIIISGVKEVDDGRETLTNVFDEIVTRHKFAQDYFRYYLTNLNAVWNKWFRRELIKDIRFETGRINAEDYLFCLEAYSKASHIKFVPICGYCFFQNAGSASHRLYKRYDQIHELDNSLEYRRVTTELYRKIGISSKQIENYHMKRDYLWFYHMVKNILNTGSPYETKEQKLKQIKRIMEAEGPRYCIQHGYITGKLSLIVKILYLINSPRLALNIISII